HFLTCSELGAAVCTTIEITSEEEDASKTFSRIEMSKNGLLFMCDGASWSTVFKEGKLVDAAGSEATTSAIRAMTSRSGRSTLGNTCPLTRITTTTKVPLRKPTALKMDTPKPIVTLVYSKKPRKSKTSVPVSKHKIIKSIFANNKETSKSWGSIVFDVPSSSLGECRIMDTIKAQQIALDDALVALANRLKIGKCNHRLSFTLKSNEPTIQVICPRLPGQKFKDPLFEEELRYFIRDLGHSEEIKTSGQVDVTNRGLKRILERMDTNFDLRTAGDHRKLQLNELSELRDQAYEKSLIYKERTKKLHDDKIKNRIFNVGNQVMLFNSRLKIFSGKHKSRDMLQICPKLTGQKFEDPPFKEEILSFIRNLGHTGEIKGMYHKKNVDYVYLLWEDLVSQVENKNSKKNNDMCYPGFTKVIIDYFMSKDHSISRRNKMFWHTARDDPMFNMIRVIYRHQDTQIHGAILHDVLTNQEMLDSKAYKDYYAVSSGSEPPKAKTKYKKKAYEPVTSSKSKTAYASKVSRLRSSAKVAKTTKKKQPAKMPKTKRLAVLSEVALSEDKKLSWLPREARKIFTCLTQVAQVMELTFNQTFLMSNYISEETESNNVGDDVTHPNLSTYKADDEEEDKEKADDDEVYSDYRMYTPPDHQLTDEEENQEGNDESYHVSSYLVSKFINTSLDIGIVDNYLSSKMKDTVDVAVQLQTNNLREDAQAENQEFLNQRGRDDQDKDEDPSAGSNRGLKRRRSGKEAESSQEPTHKESKSTSSSKDASIFQPKSSSKSVQAEEHGQNVDDLEDQSHQEFNTRNDNETSVQEALDIDESQLNPSSSPTHDREWHKTKTHAYWGTYHWGLKRQKFYGYASNMETSKDVYFRHRIIAVTNLKIMKYFGYSHLEEIIIRRQDDKLYKFREGDFKRL
nr:reverse transcriptase domain-containing protein [Tanacetum cinerariifolium]